MRIEIVGTSLETSPALSEHIRARIESSLSHLHSRVKRVIVRLADRNGHKGGEDKVCRIEARLSRLEPVEVEAVGEDAYATADRAAQRLKTAVNRRVEKRQSKRHASSPRWIGWMGQPRLA